MGESGTTSPAALVATGVPQIPKLAEELSQFCCPNPDCKDFRRFAGENLRVCERMGKGKRLRRLCCRTCQTRFSELRGTLLEYGHVPEEKVIQVLKCLTWGNSVEATADICAMDPRSVQRIVQRGGERAERFHQQKVQDIQTPQVQMDEVCVRSGKKIASGEPVDLYGAGGLFQALARGFRWLSGR